MSIQIGQAVTFVDTRGNPRPALITNIFGDPSEYPCINVAFVNNDVNQKDDYGRKIERMSSVVHQKSQTAHGNYWRTGEEGEPAKA